MKDLATLIDAIAALCWPLILFFLLLRLMPLIKEVIRSRGFTVKMLGAEVSVQEATEAVSNKVLDLSNQLTALQAAQTKAAPPPAPIDPQPWGMGGTGVPDSTGADPFEDRMPAPPPPAAAPRAAPPPPALETGPPATPRPLAPGETVLWVDDQPNNNLFETAQLRQAGHHVIAIRSTQAALDTLARGLRPGAIISDVGRQEGSDFNPAAGLDLLRNVRAMNLAIPFYFYTSRRRMEEPDLIDAGATGATASSTELMSWLGAANG